jgi:hypothetical protein
VCGDAARRFPAHALLVGQRAGSGEAVKVRYTHAGASGPDGTAGREDDMMAGSESRRDIGIIEIGHQNEPVPGIDGPRPGRRTGHDQGPGTQHTARLAAAQQAGAGHREGFFPPRRDYGDHRAGAGQAAGHRFDDAVAASQHESLRQSRLGPPGPSGPPCVRRCHIAWIAAQPLRNPVMDAWRGLQPGLQIRGAVRADVSPGIVFAAVIAPLFPPVRGLDGREYKRRGRWVSA